MGAFAVAVAAELLVAGPAVLAVVVAEPAAELAASTAAAAAPLPAAAAAVAVHLKLQHTALGQSAVAAAQVLCIVPYQPLSPPMRCPQVDELSLSWTPWLQSELVFWAPPAAAAVVGGSHKLGRLVLGPEQIIPI